jgi:hypothetical protein
MTRATALPALPYAPWEPTKTTLHLWAQIVGKIRLKSTPHRNQWWNATLAFTPRGLAARGMRQNGVDFEIEFDFIDHRLAGRANSGQMESFALHDGLSVARFFANVTDLLRTLGVEVSILAKPYGVPITTPFAADEEHHAYDADAVARWWHIGHWTVDVFDEFGSEFAGKQSPAHLFWHSFDIAMARYNGRLAPERAGANLVEREAYYYEDIAIGFWPGDRNVPAPTYYTYTAPEPETLTRQTLRPSSAAWVASGSGHLGTLPYDVVRESDDPRSTLLDFVRSGYEAGTKAAGWDARALASAFPYR